VHATQEEEDNLCAFNNISSFPKQRRVQLGIAHCCKVLSPILLHTHSSFKFRCNFQIMLFTDGSHGELTSSCVYCSTLPLGPFALLSHEPSSLCSQPTDNSYQHVNKLIHTADRTHHKQNNTSPCHASVKIKS